MPGYHERQQEEALRQFHKALLASGLVKEIKHVSGRPAWDAPPIKIRGEPLSETIIRERR
jgi:hypothetical protein